MPLIASHRHTRADLEHWRKCEAMDDSYLARCGAALDRRSADAASAISRFADAGPCYVGTSWGKDSLVVAHLARESGLPTVWVRVDGVENPDCALVRDSFLARFPDVVYDEICATSGAAAGKRTSAIGFGVAASRHGDRYVNGVRGEESSARAMSAAVHGVATARACRPILRWSSIEVYAYLRRHDLPIHPAYGCSMGGTLDRGRLRVGAIGGDRGTGHGRAEWERRYYPEIARRRP